MGEVKLTPYYTTKNGGGQLYNGDCLSVMKGLITHQEQFDLVITDPPYGIDYQSGHRKEKHLRIEQDKNLDWLETACDSLYWLLKEGSHLYMFCSWHNVDIFKQTIEKKFSIKNIIVWEKNNTGMGDLQGSYAPKHEFVIFAQKGTKKLNGSRDPDIIKIKRTLNNLHPTQKPVDLYSYFIEKSTNKGDCVIDPFSGSGTNAIACEERKRKWVCIEKEVKYCDTTIKRLSQVQTRLF